MPPPNEEGMSELLSQTADLFAVNTQSHRYYFDEYMRSDGKGGARSGAKVENNDTRKLENESVDRSGSGPRPKPLLGATTAHSKDPFRNAAFNLSAISNVNTCRIFERIPIKNAKYKTKLCDKYTVTGLCPYGNRCLFIHPDADDHNAYIRPDRLAKMEHERQALASLQQQGSGVTAVATQQQTPLTSRPPLPPARAHRPPPSWPLEPPMFFHHIDDVQKIFSVSGITRTSENENYGTSPALSAGSLSSCSLGVSPDISERLLALGDITNRRASAYTISSASPFSELESADSAKGDSPAELASPKPQSETGVDLGWSTMDSDPFRLAIANDNLARHLATIFTHD
ncbi:Tristetraprolin [Toxocara canis]|uniref:Tristetraprolin n=1 Tax=Toxocara canis TaxID=6265 RepID=A0A0B2VE80_TOXCA|nr:Tristetraprolin [Toxocara canis]